MSDHGESIIFNHPEPTEAPEITPPAEHVADEPKPSARKSKPKADRYQPFTW